MLRFSATGKAKPGEQQLSFARRCARAVRLAKDTSGVVMVEFAFAAPFLLFLGLTGLETVNYVTTHQRVSQLAMLVADTASRQVTRVDEQDITEMFFGAASSGQNIDVGNSGRIILTQLTTNGKTGNDAGNWIRWQRCYGMYGRNVNLQSTYGVEGDGRNDSSLKDGIGPAGHEIFAKAGQPVNVAEVYLDYQPLVGNNALTRFVYEDKQIHYKAAVLVRERSDQSISNVRNLPMHRRWPCNRFKKLNAF